MEYLLKFALVAAVVCVAWNAYLSRYVFLLRIVRGTPRVRRGRVTAAFLRDVEEVCRHGGVARGWLGGLPQGRRIRLVFSRQFSKACQQQLRNVWVSSD